jgi:tRNA (cmo5U34)-methyltransferase
MAQDNIFNKEQPVQPFEFNRQVVDVFDDMITRSVPMYREIIGRQARLAARFYQTGSRIYDLGCSNGNLGMALCREMGERPFEMIAVDTSVPMLEDFAARLQSLEQGSQIRLQQEDICRIPLKNASVVIVNLTLQFLPLGERDELLRRIFRALLPGGVLLLTEKVVHDDPVFNALQQESYYAFKAENGYSQLEISQKRDALENVLIPETLERHCRRLTEAGFVAVDTWLKWFNFAALIARRREEG